jgi:hypothetical protein
MRDGTDCETLVAAGALHSGAERPQEESPMPAWLPILKASLPYVTQIVTAAIPAFTRKESARTEPLVEKQIEELQAAATHNAESIRVLADKLSQTLQTLEGAATEMENRAARLQRIALFACVLAIIATGVALCALLR